LSEGGAEIKVSPYVDGTDSPVPMGFLAEEVTPDSAFSIGSGDVSPRISAQLLVLLGLCPDGGET